METDLCSNYIERCITCLGETPKMHSLSQKFDNNLDLSCVLKMCLNFEIDKPYFPRMLCESCMPLLKEFFKFKMRFVNNEVILRNNFEIKNELNASDAESVDIGDQNKINSDSLVCKDDLEGNCESYEEEIIFEIVDGDLDEQVESFIFEGTEVKEELQSDDQSHQEAIREEGSYFDDGFPNEEANVSQAPTQFKCAVCKKYFIDSLTLDMHSLKHKKHECSVCYRNFAKKKYLADHMVTHKTIRDIECPICSKVFKSRHTMRAHMRIHTNPGGFVCESCGRSFTHRGSLKTHVRLKHSLIREYLCLWCGMKFNLKPSLDKHTLRKHGSLKNRTIYKCADCDLQYLDKSTLHRHYKTKHSPNYEMVPCELCDKVYSDRGNLLRHKRKKHAEDLVEVKDDDSWDSKVKVEEYI